MTVIKTIAELEALYGSPGATSLAKEVPHLTPVYRRWLAASPFFAVATIGPGGMDCSPRGDPAGCLHIIDDKTVAFADRRGNNRLDTLRNIVVDPRIALLFFVPGINETLRINGTALVTADPVLLQSFAHEGKMPKTVAVVTISSVYFQCARALARSQLWDPTKQKSKSDVPSAGEMTKSAQPDFDAVTYDAELPARQAATMY